MTFRRNCHTPALKCANRLRSVMKLLDAFRYLERERAVTSRRRPPDFKVSLNFAGSHFLLTA